MLPSKKCCGAVFAVIRKRPAAGEGKFAQLPDLVLIDGAKDSCPQPER